MIKTYVKRPLTVEALQYDGGNIDEIKDFTLSVEVSFPQNSYFIATLEGKMFFDKGDYIVKGIKGEFYPVKKEIFELTYFESTIN